MDELYALCRDWASTGLLPQPFEHPFMVRALIAGLLIGPLLGAMGTMIVARKMAFFTQAIGHASLTGVALGLLLGEPLGATYAGLYGFSLLTAVAMLYLRNRTGAASDTIVGVVLAQTLGLGILMLVVVTKRFDVHQIEAILFGSLLTLSESDLALVAAIALLAAAVLVSIFNPFMLLCFSPVLARARNPRSSAVEYVFVLTVTVVVVASLKLAGALLVLALVVVPAAAAGRLAQGLGSYVWASAAISTVSVLGGLLLSSLWSVPTGAAMVLVASAIFYLAWLGTTFFGFAPINAGDS